MNLRVLSGAAAWANAALCAELALAFANRTHAVSELLGTTVAVLSAAVFVFLLMRNWRRALVSHGVALLAGGAGALVLGFTALTTGDLIEEMRQGGLWPTLIFSLETFVGLGCVGLAMGAAGFRAEAGGDDFVFASVLMLVAAAAALFPSQWALAAGLSAGAWAAVGVGMAARAPRAGAGRRGP